MAISILEFLILLLIAAICGGAAQMLSGYSHGGCLAAIALGFIGALLGTWIARWVGLPELIALQVSDGGPTFPVVWSIIGGTLCALVIGLITRALRPRPARRY